VRLLRWLTGRTSENCELSFPGTLTFVRWAANAPIFDPHISVWAHRMRSAHNPQSSAHNPQAQGFARVRTSLVAQRCGPSSTIVVSSLWNNQSVGGEVAAGKSTVSISTSLRQPARRAPTHRRPHAHTLRCAHSKCALRTTPPTTAHNPSARCALPVWPRLVGDARVFGGNAPRPVEPHSCVVQRGLFKTIKVPIRRSWQWRRSSNSRVARVFHIPENALAPQTR
jgi:hypothetical protein